MSAGGAQQARGRDALFRWGAALDDLLDAVDAPVTARRPWLATWVDASLDAEPWLVWLPGSDGRMEAAALLARSRRRLAGASILGLGHGTSDRSVCFPSRTPAAAIALAAAVADALSREHGPWSLVVEQQPADDPAVVALARLLRPARAEAGDGCPVLRVEGRALSDYSTKKTRRDVRQARERIEAEGRTVSVDRLVDRTAIERALPEAIDLHRRRDHAAGRRSDLDHPARRAFYERAVALHAERGEVELWLVRIDGVLAAYDVAFIDGRAYRIWDGRIAPDLTRFAPGHLSRQAIVERALADPGIDQIDWMRGVQSYKQELARSVDATVQLRAWSSPAAEAVLDLPRQARLTFAHARDEHPGLERTWMAVKERTVLRRARQSDARSQAQSQSQSQSDRNQGA
ncbi:MAG: hypothetical protein QOI20_2829 [Acidimicrobiaceae bacterium]|nr:hypothetical protein [Acidimicrobiaceae bacterium]